MKQQVVEDSRGVQYTFLGIELHRQVTGADGRGKRERVLYAVPKENYQDCYRLLEFERGKAEVISPKFKHKDDQAKRNADIFAAIGKPIIINLDAEEGHA